MFFSAQLPLSNLVIFCRTLRHSLSAGLPIVRVFKQQADRGPNRVRPVAGRIADQLEQGESLEEALKAERSSFPMMFVSLVTVGEKTGNLPEVLETLEDYFELQQKLIRDFYKQITWPMIQFFLAPFVIAAMIFFLSVLSPSGQSSLNPLGAAFTGAWGAIKFLLMYFGTFGSFIALYFVYTRLFQATQTAHEVALRIPALGPCIQAICMNRFCTALRFTMNSGMSIGNAVGLSMRATGNAAYAARADIVKTSIRGGDDLSVALGEAKLFPPELLDIMENAEEGGRVPEVMEHQAEHYADEARRRMRVLAGVASGLVYLMVACILIYLIFSIAMSVFGAYDNVGKGLNLW